MYKDKVTLDFNTKKKKLLNKQKCKKVERYHKRRLWDHYFWHKPSRFFYINGAFIVLTAISISFMNIFSIILAIILLITYILFLRWALIRYRALPKIASKKLEIFEEPIKEAIKKVAIFPGDVQDTITKASLEDDILSQDLTGNVYFELPKEITKLDFPPLAPPAKRTVIQTRKLEYVLLTYEFITSYTKAAKFDLLNPGRKPEKDGCEEKTKGALGPAGMEHYYSNISHGEFVDDTIKIHYKDGKVYDLIKVTGKPPDVKKISGNILKALKFKLRIVERQKLRKIDEFAKMEIIKHFRREEKEIKNKEESDIKAEEKKD